MEETQARLRAARGSLQALGNARAMELMSKKPQLANSNAIYATVEPVKSAGGGAAGLSRIVGGASPMKQAKMAVNTMDKKALKMGAKELRQDARMDGRKMTKQIIETQGYTDDTDLPLAPAITSKGVMGHQARGGARMVGCGSGVEVGVLPAIVPGYGNPPQAPASFARNTVGMGKKVCMKQKDYVEEHGHLTGLLDKTSKMLGKEAMAQHREVAARGLGAASSHGVRSAMGELKGGMMRQTRKDKEDERLAMEVKGVKDKVGGASSGGGRGARGAMIARLMKEKGMKLGEASRYIKEHGMA